MVNVQYNQRIQHGIHTARLIAIDYRTNTHCSLLQHVRTALDLVQYPIRCTVHPAFFPDVSRAENGSLLPEQRFKTRRVLPTKRRETSAPRPTPFPKLAHSYM